MARSGAALLALLLTVNPGWAQLTPAAAASAAAAKADAEAFINKAAAEPGAMLSDTGLVYRALKEGSGASPGPADTVRVHYRGRFTDGKEFDSSHARGQPAMFALNRVIRCWTEGVQKMKPGGKAQLTCPPGIAYGERGSGSGTIPSNTVLQFEVELLTVLPVR